MQTETPPPLPARDLHDLVKLLREALAETIPYVEGAYECSFPDADDNAHVLNNAREALALAEATINPHEKT